MREKAVDSRGKQNDEHASSKFGELGEHEIDLDSILRVLGVEVAPYDAALVDSYRRHPLAFPDHPAPLTANLSSGRLDFDFSRPVLIKQSQRPELRSNPERENRDHQYEAQSDFSVQCRRV